MVSATFAGRFVESPMETETEVQGRVVQNRECAPTWYIEMEITINQFMILSFKLEIVFICPSKIRNDPLKSRVGGNSILHIWKLRVNSPCLGVYAGFSDFRVKLIAVFDCLGGIIDFLQN